MPSSDMYPMFQRLDDLCVQLGEGHAIFLNFAMQLGQPVFLMLSMYMLKSLSLKEI
jgi:hypothetical protein